MKFNRNKFQYKLEEVKYLGLNFSHKGISIDDDRIETIRKLGNPKNRKDLQKFLGVVNYVRQFVPNMAEITAPLRELLKNNTIFAWNEGHSKAVNRLKDIIVSENILKPFNTEEEITVQTDRRISKWVGLLPVAVRISSRICFKKFVRN